jgi:hypothetical protein
MVRWSCGGRLVGRVAGVTRDAIRAHRASVRFGERGQGLDGRIGDRVVRLRAPGDVALFRIRLVTSAKGRPREVRGESLRRIGQRKKHTSDFGERAREQVGSPPFLSSSRTASWRTTARSAWARKASVTWRCQGVHVRTSS